MPKNGPHKKGPIQFSYGPDGELIVETLLDNFTELKHLGLTMDTQGNTYGSSQKIIKKHQS